MASGFTSTGFQRDTLAETITQWEDDLKIRIQQSKILCRR